MSTPIKRMFDLRSQKDNKERLSDSLTLIEKKLNETQTQLIQSVGAAKVQLEASLLLLKKKQASIQEKLKKP